LLVSPLSDAAHLFFLRRHARSLTERGHRENESTREILVDSQTAMLLADLVNLPADFCAVVFEGEPVKRAEQIASWSLRESGFRRVDALCNFAVKRGREVPRDVRVAAYEATRERRTAFREHIGLGA
jgi:hypothetical protein